MALPDFYRILCDITVDPMAVMASEAERIDMSHVLIVSH